MVDMRFMVSVVYSALSLCGNVSDLPEQTPVYPFVQESIKSIESTEVRKDWSYVVSGVYVPGFDINNDGKFDLNDVAQIQVSRDNKRVEEEKARQILLEAEEAARKAEAEMAAKAEQERIAAEEAARIAAEQQAQKEKEAQTSGEKVNISDVERRGIDVSRWQGRIDWQKVKASGVEFAVIKAGEGTETEVNFYENIKGAKEAGINCGVYWFSNAHSYDEAVEEARACLSVVSQYSLEYPVVCDFEYRSLKDNPLSGNRKALTDTLLGFLSTIEQGGFYSMLYTNTDFSDKYLELSRVTEKYDIWFAGYSVDKPGMPCGMWQYSESGRMDGMDLDNLNNGSTNVDLDISFKDYPQIMKSLHINGY